MKRKISKKMVIIFIVLVIIGGVIFRICKKDYKKVDVNGRIYYQRLNTNTWRGKYQQEEIVTDAKNIEDYNVTKVVSYSEYVEIIDSINDSKIQKKYSNKNSNHIILYREPNRNFEKMELIDCVKSFNSIIIYGHEKFSPDEYGGYFIAIPTNMPVGTPIEYRECYTENEINNLKNYNNRDGDIENMGCFDKPIIYLYPTEETELTVKLGNTDKITCSYPFYTTGWNVIAKPNGDLVDIKTNKNLYALYYESENVCKFGIERDGFIVKGCDVAEFLEKKLEILGLTERESEEFIVYWLPKLQGNKYNYIRFATKDEIDENMPLNFSVEPDTLIRVLMIYKGLDKPINIEEQQLQSVDRKGFVAVEWGGTEIKM